VRLTVAGCDDCKTAFTTSFDKNLHLILGVLHFLWRLGPNCQLGITGNLIADIKTCELCDMQNVERSIVKYGYHRQAAFYLRGLEALGYKVPQLSFVFVFFETVAPFTVRRVVLSGEYLHQARKEVNQAIALWQMCLASNRFPTTPPDTLTVEIPHYLSENDGQIEVE
jgi:hypothetical protein